MTAYRTVTDAADFGRVAVLFGGTSAEREISLLTGQAVLDALLRRDVDAVAMDPADERAVVTLAVRQRASCHGASEGRG